jgi:hypothetical protein
MSVTASAIEIVGERSARQGGDLAGRRGVNELSSRSDQINYAGP